MLLRIMLIMFWGACVTALPAQTGKTGRYDSSLFKLADRAFAVAFSNADSAVAMAKDVKARASEKGDGNAVANAWNALGWAYMHKGSLDSSVNALREAWEIFNALGSDDNTVRVCINISEVYTKQSNLSAALRYLVKADSLCVKTGNIAYHTNVKRQFAIVYRESGDLKRSAEYFRQTMDGFAALKDDYRYINTGISLSILHRKMKLPDSSLAILMQCLGLIRQRSVMPYQLAMVNEHLGETYFDKKNYGIALSHYKTAYAVFREMHNNADAAYEAFNIGRAYSQAGEYAEAAKYLLESYAINDSLRLLNYQLDASQELAALYKKQGNWELAYRYAEKASVLKDSLNLADQVAKTNELKERFETEKKEHEISLLKAKNQLAELSNRKTRLLQYIFLILFVASLVIGWLLLNRGRMKRRLHDQLLRNQIARDLHDDIGSILSSIDISSRVALARSEDANTVTVQLQTIQQHARKTMDSMSDIVWSIDPGNDSIEHLFSRMREFAAEICEPSGIRLVFETEPQSEGVSLETAKRKNVFLIFKEAVNNAVKYSQCKELSVHIHIAQQGLDMRVEDDGKGFVPESARMGNGLANMRSRAESIGGRLEVLSAPGAGTKVILHCPIP